jgi:hypothetical protein
LVFASVAVVAGETTATGFELPSTPTLPSAPQTLTAPSLPTAPALPSAPQTLSVPTLPSAPLPSAPHAPSASMLPTAPTLSSSSPPPSVAPELRGTSSAGAPKPPLTGAGQPPTSPGYQLPRSTVSYVSGARAASRQHGRRDDGKSKKRRFVSTRRLRRALTRLRGCFYALNRRERRVLVLRAGLNGRHALSRRGVAKRLRISRKRVGRIERRALHRLRAAARSDGCATGVRNRPEAQAGVSRFVGASGIVQALQPAEFSVPAFQPASRSPEGAIQSPLGRRLDPPSASQPSPGDGGGAGTTAAWALAILLIIAMIEVRAFLKLRRQK